MLIDSHSHLFLEEFADDLPQVMERAQAAGVSHILMPNIDHTTLEPMLQVCASYPGMCYPMIGLHPTSVNETFEEELAVVAAQLADDHRRFVAVGEIGIDLYWDKTFLEQQLTAFKRQVDWALEYQLPVVIHSRDAFPYIYKVLLSYKETPLKGIFHSFGGTAEEAAALLEFPGFMLGINGVVTFKNSALPKVLKTVPLDRLVLETDSPYLTPVPYRGRRNESAYVAYVCAKLAEVYGCTPEEVAEKTSAHTLEVFGRL